MYFRCIGLNSSVMFSLEPLFINFLNVPFRIQCKAAKIFWADQEVESTCKWAHLLCWQLTMTDSKDTVTQKMRGAECCSPVILQMFLPNITLRPKPTSFISLERRGWLFICKRKILMNIKPVKALDFYVHYFSPLLYNIPLQVFLCTSLYLGCLNYIWLSFSI